MSATRYTTITISSKRYEDSDNCLAAAAADFSAGDGTYYYATQKDADADDDGSAAVAVVYRVTDDHEGIS